jgi:SPP1 gp7 family putative phage head morphogenesis protein
MTVAGADLAFAFGLSPDRAIRYLQGKGLRVTGGHLELLDQGHHRYFTVANVSKADVVADIHTELLRTLRNGGTLQQFKDQLIPRLKAKGWLGRDYSADELIRAGRLDTETGEIRKGLTAARLKTIFRTNMQSAYMAGKYREFMDQAKQRPYWQYTAVIDLRTRDMHATMDGKVFRYDDPIWKVIWPPNDYNCRCSVRSYSQRDIDRRGLTVSSSAGKLSQVQIPQPDGSFITVTRYSEGGPAGVVFNPAPGFDSNPGVSFPPLDPGVRQMVKEAPGQIDHADLALPVLQSIADAVKLPAPVLLPKAATRAEAADVVRNVLGLSADNPVRLVETPAGEVLMRNEYIDHITEKEPDARERFANFILPTLEDPFEVWLTMYDDGRPRRRYIGLYRASKYDIMVVVKVLTDGTVLWNVIHAQSRSLNKQRVGKLLFARK